MTLVNANLSLYCNLSLLLDELTNACKVFSWQFVDILCNVSVFAKFRAVNIIYVLFFLVLFCAEQ